MNAVRAGLRPASAGSSTKSGITRSCSRRGGQRRVVVDAQVAPEPDDGGSTRTMGTDKRRRYAHPVSLVRDFPLFPLGIVALPSELVPLHIFEERYKTMVARVLEEEGEFGIVWVSDDGLRAVGCACVIAEALERLPDGRLNLVARGTRVFRIEARQEELAYPAGTVEFLSDATSRPTPTPPTPRTPPTPSSSSRRPTARRTRRRSGA